MDTFTISMILHTLYLYQPLMFHTTASPFCYACGSEVPRLEGCLNDPTYALFADHFGPSPANLLSYVRNDICKKCVS